MQVKADPYLRQPLGRLRDFGGDDAGECNCRRVVLEVCAGAKAERFADERKGCVNWEREGPLLGAFLFLTAKLHKKWGRGGRGGR